MADGSLQIKEIQNTYKDVIVLKGTDNEGLTGGLKTLRDGAGNDSALQISTAEVKSNGNLTVSGTGTFTSIVYASGFSGSIVGDVLGNVTGNVTGDLTGTADNANMVSVTPSSFQSNKRSIVTTDDDVDVSISGGYKTLRHNQFSWIKHDTGEMGCTDFTASGNVRAIEFKNHLTGGIFYNSAFNMFYGDLTGDVTGDISGTSGGTSSALTVDDSTLELDSGTTFDGSAAKTISVKDEGITLDKLPHINQYEFIGRTTAGNGDPEILSEGQVRNALGGIQSGADVTASNTCNTPNVNANWNAIAGGAEILNKPTIPTSQKVFMQWSMRWNTGATTGNSGTNRRRWYTIDKTYGPSDQSWDSYSTGTNSETSWYDSRNPGIVIPDNMTLKKYSLYGTITWGAPTDTGVILLEVKKNTNLLTWNSTAQSVPLTLIGSQQSEMWGHHMYTIMSEDVNVSMVRGDIIIPQLCRDSFLSVSTQRYIEGTFILEFEKDL